MFLSNYFLLSGLILVVAAITWDDFSNNLATDLAPFLTLFGEQVTKQYLSESTRYFDYFIFAMAPMGIITAIVSVIRVCGSPTLRAFVGRAQEGGGNAEAELCSSTSADVCELFNNGSITRVFGRPMILEVIFDPQDQNFGKGEIGIYSFLQHVKRCRAKEKEYWAGETQDGSNANSDPESVSSIPSDPIAPNLSLNLGIRRQSQYMFWAVATGGFVLQAGVLIFGALVTYHWRWKMDDKLPESYAFPLTLVGTVLICGGTYCCAALIGESTKEWTFLKQGKQDPRDPKSPPYLYWIQPGGQIIGDQTFHTFAYIEAETDSLQEYIISRKMSLNPSHRANWQFFTWIAVGITVSGFILQFTGLRSMHSAIPVAQLGATLAMSMARAGLRMRRLAPDANHLDRYSNQIIGHELDWLALQFGKGETRLNVSSRENWFWNLSTQQNRISFESPKPPNNPNPNNPNTVSRLLAYRSCLAAMTKSQATHDQALPAHFRDDKVTVRQTAQQLARLIDETIDILFRSKNIHIPKNWGRNAPIYWHMSVSLSKPAKTEVEPFYLKFCGEEGSNWRLKLENDLEALLGLWLWSLMSDPLVEMKDKSADLTSSSAADFPIWRIIAAEEEFLWKIKMQHHESLGSFSENDLPLKLDHHHPGTIWKTIHSQTDTKGRAALKAYSEKDLKNHTTNTVRFFGWDVTKSSNMQSSKGQIPQPRIWSARTNAPLLSLCAQEVFTSFLWSILGLVIISPSASVGRDAPVFPLKNSPFPEITDAVFNAGLGNRGDILLCMLSPAVYHISRQCSIKEEVQLATASATEYRKRQDWEDAREVLRRMWDTCKGSQPDERRKFLLTELAIALSELCGWASQNEKQGFANEVVGWLRQQISEPYKIEWSQERRDAMNRYIDTAIKPADASNQDANQDERTKTLTDLVWPKISTSEPTEQSTKDKTLIRAATEGWTEIVLALLARGATREFANSMDSEKKTALYYAAERGHLEIAAELIYRGASHNLFDHDGQTPLWKAAANGHDETVYLLLQAGAEPNAKNSEGRTPLWTAAANGHYKTVRLLLDKGADPHVKDKWSETPLQWAANNGHLEIVDLLLQGGVAPDAEDGGGMTSLWRAAEHGHDKIVDSLLRTGKVNPKKKDRFGRPAIWFPAEHGYLKTAELLLQHGADPNVRYKTPGVDDTVLFWIARRGHLNTAKLLLEVGKVEPDLQDFDGRRPLSRAAECGHLEIVEILLNTGKVDPKAEDYDGKTALSWAIENGHVDIVKLLLQKNVNTDIKDDKERTLLWWAANNGHQEIVDLLLNACNIRPDEGDLWGWTPLWQAAEAGHCNIVKRLLNTGNVSPDTHFARTGELFWRTPLMRAAENGHEKVVELLLSSDEVDPNVKNQWNETALWWAARNGHLEIVKRLLDTRKVDPDVKGHEKRTPLSWAAENGHQDIARLLIQTGMVDLEATYGQHRRTPLYWAIDSDSYELIELLLQRNANINATDSMGMTPISQAARGGHSKIVGLLLRAGASPDIHDEDGETPLVMAAKKGHPKVVQQLLQIGNIDLEAKDRRDGRTSLLKAAIEGHQEVVKLLLGNDKVNLNARDNSGRTALSWAQEKEYQEIIELLQTTMKARGTN